MPFRRKQRSSSAKLDKENAVHPAVPPPSAAVENVRSSLYVIRNRVMAAASSAPSASDKRPPSPQMIRCHSDTSQRLICADVNPNTVLSAAAKSAAAMPVSAAEKMANLLSLNSTLVKEVAALRQSHCRLVAEMEGLDIQLRAAAYSAESLRREKAELEEEADDMRSEMAAELEKFAAEKSAMVAEMEKMAADKAALLADVDVKATKMAELAEKINKMAAEKACLESEVDMNAREKTVMEAAMHKVAAEMSSLEAELEKVRADNAALKTDVDLMEADLGKCTAEKVALEVEMANMAAEKASVEAENEARAAEIARIGDLLKDESERRRHYAMKQSQELHGLKNENLRLLSQGKMQQEEIKDLQKELQHSKEASQKQISSIAAANRRLETEIAACSVARRQLESDLSAVRTQNQQQVESLRQQISALEAAMAAKVAAERQRREAEESVREAAEVARRKVAEEMAEVRRAMESAAASAEKGEGVVAGLSMEVSALLGAAEEGAAVVWKQKKRRQRKKGRKGLILRRSSPVKLTARA